jgi:hypothetical protein
MIVLFTGFGAGPVAQEGWHREESRYAASAAVSLIIHQ